MRPTLFLDKNHSNLSDLQIEAYSGYSHALIKLINLAKTSAEAAFRLGLVFKEKNDQRRANEYFLRAKELEAHSINKKYTYIIHTHFAIYCDDITNLPTKKSQTF